MSPYFRGQKFVIAECGALHAFHWFPVPPRKPASISVCGMARERRWTKRHKGRELKFLAWMAVHHVTCGSCVRVLEAYTRRER